ncbi:MAG: peroxidase family protein [Planctomycetota bacterium]
MRPVLVATAAVAGLAASAHATVRTIDGSANNLSDSSMGAANTQLLRMMPADYADGISAMGGASRPNPRDISNAISAQTAPLGNSMDLTSMFWQWGQFIDHDFSLTGGGSESVPIAVNTPGDPLGPSIHFNRSVFDPTTGTSAANPRQHMNEITHWLDGSMVYGSDNSTATGLRANDGSGRLLVSADNMLPVNDGTLGVTMGNDGQFPDNTLRAAGDVRANEVAGLTALHTVFVREHNRLADQIKTDNPAMSGEDVYQQARKLVGAQIQKITYEEWLPSLLGSQSLDAYAGYDNSVDSSIATEFSTAAFRIGHTMLNQEYLKLDQGGNVTSEGNLSLAASFFDPSVLTADNMSDIFRGLAWQEANEVDTQVIDEVRNMLFGPPGGGFGLDLLSLNLQRGRDHGLPDYNAMRAALGLGAATDFSDITSDPALAAELASLYGDVDDVDIWIGLMSEDKLAGSGVGETMARILIDQFTRLRDGDRYFYLNDGSLTFEDLAFIENSTLADLLMRNTDISFLQGNVFVMGIPAPATAALLGTGGLLATRRRRR